jgi:hypothetical protein
VATDTTSVAAASRNFRIFHPVVNQFSKHGTGHWKNWLYELSVLSPMNHMDVLIKPCSMFFMKARSLQIEGAFQGR